MALSAAAIALPGLASQAQATMPTESVIGYRYTTYNESTLADADVASGSLGRYDINVNQWSLSMPVNGQWSVSASLQDETLSGASPWYNKPADAIVVDANGQPVLDSQGNPQYQPDYTRPVVVMSGASPGYETGGLVGIEEHRTDASLATTYYYTGGSVSGNVAFSTEDDYESLSGGLSLEYEFDKKQTVVAAGFSYSSDDIFYEDFARTVKKNNSGPLPDGATKKNFS